VQIRFSFPLVDEILQPFAAAIGADLPGYRHHVYRVLHYFSALAQPATIVPDSIQIAAAFHDIGIWTDRTFDYLEPSVRQAKMYLATNRLGHLEPEIAALITEHHKVRAYRQEFAASVETYRQADLVDLSLGMIRFAVPLAVVRSAKAAFPDAGFHWRLVTLAARQFVRSPLRPLPMIHW
jgi:hypothetical protein